MFPLSDVVSRGDHALSRLTSRYPPDSVQMNTELFPEFVQRFNLRFFPTGILFKDRKVGAVGLDS
jgi:hypothetical protein